MIGLANRRRPSCTSSCGMFGMGKRLSVLRPGQPPVVDTDFASNRQQSWVVSSAGKPACTLPVNSFSAPPTIWNCRRPESPRFNISGPRKSRQTFPEIVRPCWRSTGERIITISGKQRKIPSDGHIDRLVRACADKRTASVATEYPRLSLEAISAAEVTARARCYMPCGHQGRALAPGTSLFSPGKAFSATVPFAAQIVPPWVR